MRGERPPRIAGSRPLAATSAAATPSRVGGPFHPAGPVSVPLPSVCQSGRPRHGSGASGGIPQDRRHPEVPQEVRHFPSCPACVGHRTVPRRRLSHRPGLPALAATARRPDERPRRRFVARWNPQSAADTLFARSSLRRWIGSASDRDFVTGPAAPVHRSGSRRISGTSPLPRRIRSSRSSVTNRSQATHSASTRCTPAYSHGVGSPLIPRRWPRAPVCAPVSCQARRRALPRLSRPGGGDDRRRFGPASLPRDGLGPRGQMALGFHGSRLNPNSRRASGRLTLFDNLLPKSFAGNRLSGGGDGARRPRGDLIKRRPTAPRASPSIRRRRRSA